MIRRTIPSLLVFSFALIFAVHGQEIENESTPSATESAIDSTRDPTVEATEPQTESQSDDANEDAETTQETRILSLNVKPGDSVKYKLEIEKLGKNKDMKSESLLTILVKEVNESGATLEYRFSNVTPIRPALSSGIVAQITKMVEGLTVVYTVDSDGNFKSIENKDDITNFILKAGDLLVEEQPLSTEEKTRMKTAFKAAFADPDQVQHSISEEINILHMFYGVNLPLDEMQTYETTSPNPWLGDIKGQWCITATDSGSSWNIEALLRHDPDDLANGVEAFVKKMGEASGKPLDETKKEEMRKLFKQMVLSEKYKVNTENNNSWPTVVDYTKEMSLMENKEIKRYTYTRLPN